MNKNFCSSILKDLDSKLLKKEIFTEALSVDELNSIYSPDKKDLLSGKNSISDLEHAQQINGAIPNNKTSLPSEAQGYIGERPVSSADDVSLEKNTDEADSYIIRSNKPYKLAFAQSSSTDIPLIKEDFDYSMDTILDEEPEILVPMSLAPEELQDKIDILEPPQSSEKCEESGEDSEDLEKEDKKSDYDLSSSLPPLSKEELKQLADIASKLTPNGKVIITNSIPMDELPIKKIGQIMAPEDDMDGYSVAGLDNSIGLDLL